MKAYLITTGTLFALMTVLHVFIMFEHWHSPTRDLHSILAPVVICVLSAVLALWAFRLVRSVPPTAL